MLSAKGAGAWRESFVSLPAAQCVFSSDSTSPTRHVLYLSSSALRRFLGALVIPRHHYDTTKTLSISLRSAMSTFRAPSEQTKAHTNPIMALSGPRFEVPITVVWGAPAVRAPTGQGGQGREERGLSCHVVTKQLHGTPTDTSHTTLTLPLVQVHMRLTLSLCRLQHA
jgi:hypothetical protein